MADYITIRKAGATCVARAGGAILAESENALELIEGDYPPVTYFPRADVAMAFLDRSDTVTTCVHKGEATHFHIEAKSGRINDAAWSYEAPKDEVAEIKDHIAFYKDRVAVEDL